MTSRIHTTGFGVLAIVLAVALLPASGLAQAGLSGNAFSGQAEEFGYGNRNSDRNFTNKSALGQLEELSGGTVDRSSSQSSNRSTYTREAPQPSRAAQMRADFNQEVTGMVASALVNALFSNLFNDNSAQQKAAAEAAAAQAAARAAAEAEAFRVQQELARKARILKAQRYRAEWDAREAEVGDRLGGAFDVTGTGTAFFGRPANPDAATVAAILGQDTGGPEPAAAGGVPDAPDASGSDPSAVDLRGSSLVVPLLRPTVPAGRGTTIASRSMRPPLPGTPRWAYELTDTYEPPPPKTPSQLQGLLAFFGPWLGEYYKGLGKTTVKETIWARLEFVPGQKLVKKLWGAKEQVDKDTEELSKAYAPLLLGLGGAINAANNMGSYSNRDGLAEDQFASLQQNGGKVVVDIWKMIYKQITGHAGKIDLAKFRYGSDESSDTSLHDVPVDADYPRLMFGSGGKSGGE